MVPVNSLFVHALQNASGFCERAIKHNAFALPGSTNSCTASRSAIRPIDGRVLASARREIGAVQFVAASCVAGKAHVAAIRWIA